MSAIDNEFDVTTARNATSNLLVIPNVLVAMPQDFLAVEGGGSLILAWQIKNKRVLVVGGGEVSTFWRGKPFNRIHSLNRLLPAGSSTCSTRMLR